MTVNSRLWISLVTLFVGWTAIVQANGGDADLYVDILVFQGDAPTTDRLDVIVVVPFSTITFERTGSGYTGRYRASIRIEQQNTIPFDTIFDRTLRTYSYDATIGKEPAHEYYQFSRPVSVGGARVTVEILDRRTNMLRSVQSEIDAPDFQRVECGLSSPMLVSHIREDTSGLVVTPSLSETVPPDEPFFLFFETYNRGVVRTASMRLDVRDKGGTEVYRQWAHALRPLKPGRAQEWIRVSPTSLPRGALTLVITACDSLDTNRVLATTSRRVVIAGGIPGRSLSTEELDLRVRQLRYVATEGEQKAIRAGSTTAERQRLFSEFWLGRDPSRETPENEAMDEYYRRVDHANAMFRSYAEGWLTDKGRVYITYGPPDNITTDTFQADGKNVETWYYRRRGLRLVFTDQSGFGDYRLTTPLPPGEKFKYSGG